MGQPAARRGEPPYVSPLFPRWPPDEMPVGYVTNGVHVPSWDSRKPNRALDWGVRPQGRWRRQISNGGRNTPRRARTPASVEPSGPRSPRNPLIAMIRSPLRPPDWPDCRPRPRSVAAVRRHSIPMRLPWASPAGSPRISVPPCCCTTPSGWCSLPARPGRPVQLIVAGKAHPPDGARAGSCR